METREAPARPTPEQLLLRFRETHDPRALGDLYDATAPHLFRVALALAPDEASAEDALQETYLALMRAAGSWDPGRPALPWLGGILRLCILEARRRDRRTPDPARLAGRAPPEDPGAAAERDEAARLATGAMENLPEPYREVAILRWRYGLEPSEIAHARGVPPGTIRSLLHRAAAAMRRAMGALPALLFGHRFPRGLERIRADVLDAAGRAAMPISGAAAAAAMGGALMTKNALAGGIAAAVLLGAACWLVLGGGGGDAPPAAGPGESSSASAAGGASRQPGTEPPQATAPRESAAAPPAAAAPPPASVEHLLRIRVLDEERRPIEGGQVMVAGTENPFSPGSVVQGLANAGEPKDWSVATADGRLTGRLLATGADGRIEVRFPGPRRVYMAPWPSCMKFGPPTGTPPEKLAASYPVKWVDTPATDVEFLLHRTASGVVAIRAVDLSTGKALTRFAAVLEGAGLVRLAAENGLVEQEVRIPDGVRSATVTATLVGQRSWSDTSQRVVVPADARVEVMLAMRSSREVRGRVLGADGRPLRDAVVFPGDGTAARGDEPFKPWDMKRVRDSERTGADGSFTLRTDEDGAASVTAWHETHSPVTVHLAEASEMRLPARGTIRARLVDAGGAPLPGFPVSLDRSRSARSDAEGRFSFDGVEAGVRGLLVATKRWVSIRVEPSPADAPPAEEVEIGPGIDEVRVEVRADGRPLPGKFDGALVGTKRLASFLEARVSGGEFTGEDVLPGRYWLVARPSLWAAVEVADRAAVADAGRPGVTIAGEPGTRFFLVPADSDELLHLMAARVSTETLPASGRWSAPLLPPGRWSVGIEGRGIIAHFSFTGEKVECSLPSPGGGKGRK